MNCSILYTCIFICKWKIKNYSDNGLFGLYTRICTSLLGDLYAFPEYSPLNITAMVISIMRNDENDNVPILIILIKSLSEN